MSNKDVGIAKCDKIIAQIADDFTQQQENFEIIVDTLPTNYLIGGGESALTQIYAKDEETRKIYYEDEIATLNSSLYMALYSLKSDNFMFYNIQNYGGYVSFVTTVKGFTVFSILHLNNSTVLEDILIMYDDYTVVIEDEWYIAWYTREGV